MKKKKSSCLLPKKHLLWKNLQKSLLWTILLKTLLPCLLNRRLSIELNTTETSTGRLLTSSTVLACTSFIQTFLHESFYIFIKQTMVLKWGVQFSLQLFFEESYLVKQNDWEYNNRHARMQAHIRQVFQPMHWEHSSLEGGILGEPQVINLSFLFVKGDNRPH